MAFALSKIQLMSPAFESGGWIAKKHTGEGEDISPALTWSSVPEGTESFAVVCHDPDAPKIESGTYGFVHWVLYNIPASVTSLSEDVDQFTAGVHDGGGMGYMGPMPPKGHGTHTYYFMIFALNEDLHLPEGLSLWQLLQKIEPHVLGMNRLAGTYNRV